MMVSSVLSSSRLSFGNSPYSWKALDAPSAAKVVGIVSWSTTLAGDFHRFYNACRIKGEEQAVQAARLKLADSTRLVLANGLGLLGVNAPEKM